MNFKPAVAVIAMSPLVAVNPFTFAAWKLLGKKEMFIPYNTQQFHTKKVDQVLEHNHLNPDYVRWELYRVWVVEATLAPSKRHALPTAFLS